jgi:primosomal protein N' (replication factor Y) (superfamily II helicase)
VVARGNRESTTKALAEEISARLQAIASKAPTPIRILGPAPAPMAKLRGDYRYQIQLHAADGELLRDAVRRATGDLKCPDGVAWIVDVDPLDMM